MAAKCAAVLRPKACPSPPSPPALDMRYRGQSYELTVPLALPITSRGAGCRPSHAFHAAHAQRYGYAMPDEPVTVVTLRVRGSGPGAQPACLRLPWHGEDASPGAPGR